MKKLKTLILISILFIGFIGCSDDQSQTASEKENKEKLDNYINKLVEASDNSKASKTLDINNRD